MKKRIVALVMVFALSLACQLFVPPTGREGTVISDCADSLRAVIEVQPGEIPAHLMETGRKQGGEFDANLYFTVLTRLSMRAGYALDYVYLSQEIGGSPALYARPVDQAPYASIEDVPAGAKLTDYHDYVEIEDLEQGYFEYVVLNMMARQFYLYWHANYNDAQIICNREAANQIVTDINDGDFGYKMDLKQQAQVRAMQNIEPLVKLTDDSALVEVVIFTRWGGFFRQTYTISRSFPHTIDMKEENLVPYECGIMF